MAERASDAGFVVATPTIASDGMLERIVEKIQDAGESGMDKRKLRLAGGSLGALGFSAGLQFTREVQESKSFQHKLTQLVRVLSKQGKGILVLVDELQANSPEIRQLVIAYQELVGEGLNIAMVEVGVPAKMADVAKAMGESPDYAQKYRRRLMDSGIILSPERGKVSFAVPYLEEYLRARV